jgi:hypothetical protein
MRKQGGSCSRDPMHRPLDAWLYTIGPFAESPGPESTGPEPHLAPVFLYKNRPDDGRRDIRSALGSITPKSVDRVALTFWEPLSGK